MSGDKGIAGEKAFQNILYSQCWEDPELHRVAMQLQPHHVVFAIGSAGDNVFAHLLENPAKVIAVDLNPSQIALIELKIAGFRLLDWPTLLSFLGVRPSNDRRTIYMRLRTHLSPRATEFWDHHSSMIERGVIHGGRFESYFHKFQQYVLRLTHSQQTRTSLFEKRSLDEQRNFYRDRWNNRRWRLLFHLFFNQFTMARLGRSKAHFAHVDAKHISRQFFERSRLVFEQLPVTENPFIQYMILGHYPYLESLHPYLLEKNFESIRSRLDRIELHLGSVGELLDQLPERSVDAWNLSDIFEYMDESVFAELGQKIHRISADNATLSYWNLLVPRRLSISLPDLFCEDQALSRDLWMKDRAFVYGRYSVEHRRR